MREMYLAVISRADPRAYRQAMLALGLFNSRKRLGRIQAPTLVITGTQDSTVSPARQKLLVEGIPGASQVLIPQAGHAVSDRSGGEIQPGALGFLRK